MPSRALFGWLWLACAVFIGYGSLVPFDFRPLTPDAAWRAFTGMPWLELGLDSRVDWLSNLILYVPLSLCGALCLSRSAAGGGAGLPQGLGALVSAAAAVCLAIGIEYLQVYFPPRTVSLNDLLAESLGAMIGATIAVLAGRRLARLATRLRSAQLAEAALAAALAYGLVYLAVVLFPFDFSNAREVFERKLEHGQAGWWLAPATSGQGLLAWLKLCAEALAVLPLGVAWAWRWPRVRWPIAAAGGLAAGILIEVAQLFLLATTAQGASGVARGFGVALGALLAAHHVAWFRFWTPTRRRVGVIALSLPWLATVLFLAGWGRTGVSAAGWHDRLAEVRWIPFYYHYFTNEAVALASVLAVGGLFAWVGFAGPLLSRHTANWVWPFTALVAAALVEASKLLLPTQHPDPTNLLIAALAATISSRLIARWLRLSATARPTPGSASMPTTPSTRSAATPSVTATRPAHPELPIGDPGDGPREGPNAPTASPAPGTRVDASTTRLWPAAVVAIVSVVSIRALPDLGIVHAAAIALCLALIARWPLGAFVIVPVMIGLSDVVRYTGNRIWEPLDSVMLGLLVLGTIRRSEAGRSRRRDAWLVAAVVLVLVTGLPWDPPRSLLTDPNALFDPLGPINALILAKGTVWALVLAWFARRARLRWEAGLTAMGTGFTIALAGVCVLTVFERLAFVGWLDFDSPHRAGGPFSAIRTGGAYIEGFLVIAAPFAAVMALRARHRLSRFASAGVLLAGAYTTMITYSRAGQVAFLVATALALLASRPGVTHETPTPAAVAARGRRSAALRWARPLAIAAAVIAVTTPILFSGFAAQRLAMSSTDLATRELHWQRVLDAIGGSATRWLIGSGFASVPAALYLQTPPAERPALFRRSAEADNHHLAWVPGVTGYLDQTIDPAGAPVLHLTVRARTRVPGASLTVMSCVKDFVQSTDCVTTVFKPPADGQWHRQETRWVMVQAPARLPARLAPRVVSLMPAGGPLDIDDLSLTDPAGRELVENGGFEHAASAWYHSSDQHLAWHAKNLVLHLLLENGVIGLLVLGALFALAWIRLGRITGPTSAHAVALSAALLGVLGVGAFDSLIDAPRFSQLLLMLLLTGAGVGFGTARGITRPAAARADTASTAAAPTDGPVRPV